MAEKIKTLHPDPDKQGVNIDRAKYEQMKTAVLAIIAEAGEIGFSELMNAAGLELPNFKGSVGWYVTTVKLDLEARGMIERIPNQSPQRLRLSK